MDGRVDMEPLKKLSMKLYLSTMKEEIIHEQDRIYCSSSRESRDFPRKIQKNALKAFVDVVAEQLKAGDKVQLVGFGTFEVSERAAREGRNPQTGETMTIAACKAPKFKAGKALKGCNQLIFCRKSG